MRRVSTKASAIVRYLYDDFRKGGVSGGVSRYVADTSVRLKYEQFQLVSYLPSIAFGFLDGKRLI